MKRVEFKELTLGEIVTGDFRAAEVFRKAGLDFCCGGKKRLDEACQEKNLWVDSVVKELDELQDSEVPKGHDYKNWAPEFLCDYIVNTHHQYVLKSLPALVFYTDKIARVHGERHPELVEVADLFARINSELLQHLEMEENVLFPAIRRMKVNPLPNDPQLIRSEIERMSGEHEFAGGAMDRINELTDHYSVPEDACNTYRISMQLLREFEDDLHIHVHLENNILFRKMLASRVG